MAHSLCILNVEDSDDDSLLLKLELEKGGLILELFQRVATSGEMKRALAEGDWDAIISDYTLPGFGGLQALKLLQASGKDIPFILVSGLVGEDAAVEAMKAGAHDFICKANMARLVPAILRELDEHEVREQRRLAEERLKESEAKFRALHQNASDAIFFHDLDGVILEANDTACDWLGYTREKLQGHKLSAFIVSLTTEQLAVLKDLPPCNATPIREY